VEEILPESSLPNLFGQIFVSGSHQQHSAETLSIFNQPDKTSVIKKTQQLHLRLGIRIANLIQKNHAAHGFFQNAAPVAVGTVKAPFLWPNNSE
jgi:hypothetical protein